MNLSILVLFIACVLFQGVVIAYLFWKQHQKVNGKSVNSSDHSQQVKSFYNENTDRFLAVYGEVIQAFRTRNVTDYLSYTAESMGLQPQMRVVDAGCGVCGPALHFAKMFESLTIDAVTISDVQKAMAEDRIKTAGLGNIQVFHADFHHLHEFLSTETYDRVYFLESFGHSSNKTAAIKSAYQCLKPGGKLYIKDLFLRESKHPWEATRIQEISQEINEAYVYQIADLYEVLSALRKEGFLLEWLRVPQVERDAFEQLTISNDFQNLFNVGKIESWEDYVFPIDFFELLATRPLFNPSEQAHLYFMNQRAKTSSQA